MGVRPSNNFIDTVPAIRMNHIRLCIVTLVLGMFCVFMSGSAVAADTLENAVESAIVFHPSIESAKANLTYSEDKAREERSGYFPEISVNGTGGRQFADNSTSRGLSVTRGSGYSYLWEGSVTARQMVFDGFETSNRVSSAEARRKAADMKLLDSQEKIADAATQAYIDLSRARRGLQMLKGYEEKVQDYLQRIKSMTEQGAADEAEYQQARDIRVVLEGIIGDYEGQVRTAETNFFEAAGYVPTEELLLPSPRLEMIPKTVDLGVAMAKERHPAVIREALIARATEYEVDMDRAALYPDVNGELSYLKNDKEDVIGGEAEDARAVMKLSWNFDTGGAQLAKIDQRISKHKEAVSKVQETERRSEREVRLAYNDYQTAWKRFENRTKRLELNEILFKTNTAQFEAARINLLQLMRSNNQLFTARLEKMNAEYRVLASQFAILSKIGRLQESLFVTGDKIAAYDQE